MYLGNNLQVAFPSYTNIDDISGSFNGSTTSFALTVNGSAPVPFPLSTNQCLISVNGVVQRPDDSGTEGFRLSGGNIIFSAAPGSGQDFFGVILAGADYVNVGVTYPSGSSVLPSVTFESDLDTGLYNPGANQLGITCGTTTSTVFTATGYSFLAGTAGAPGLYPAGDTNTGLYSPGADQLGLTTGGTVRLNIESDGTLNVAGTTNYETLVTSDDDIPNKKYVDDAITAGSITFPLLATSLGTVSAPTYSFSADTNTGIYSPGADQLSITTAGTERLRLDSTGQIEVVSLGSAAAPVITFTTDPNTGIYSPGADQLSIATAGTERLRINSTGQAGFVSLGTAGSPVISFTADTNTGIYSPGADQLAIATGGTARLTIDASGDATFSSNVTLNAQGDLRFADSDSSNWVALQSPSTVASNVTWTLPSSDGSSGQFLRTNGSGTLSFATPSGGKVLQVTSTTWTGNSSTSSSSFTSSGLTHTITPTSATSSILVIAAVETVTYSLGQTVLTYYRDDTTNLGGTRGFYHNLNRLNGQYQGQLGTLVYLDSPATTSNTRYRVYFYNSVGNNSYLNYNPQDSQQLTATITLMEIAP